ncbi:hypothetical protein Poli38472_001023 [Pythium oligandrum]|uniref:Uncharacterized protein n=1 Tax=Pythium oligandrum TaxID=41045 RepID=A0A8K1FRC8_PYTOL|nr:hypothetical protein Poli38472_001023 [Pythium oligandrum]|eukprot:TMW68867.1 hypothetical protein Poli38472_001023 [Pythium oligandrum]
MLRDGGRKRERSALPTPEEGGGALEKELKRLRLAHEYRSPRDAEEDGDAVMGDGEYGFSPQVRRYTAQDLYQDINATLRECHYLRQLRRFQAERVSYLERRPSSADATTAANIYALQERQT